VGYVHASGLIRDAEPLGAFLDAVLAFASLRCLSVG